VIDHDANVRARSLNLSERSSNVRLVAMLSQCLLEQAAEPILFALKPL
jgi:hypothetical protein